MTRRLPITKKINNVSTKSVKSFEFTNVLQGKAHKLPDKKPNVFLKLISAFGGGLKSAQANIMKKPYGGLMVLVVALSILVITIAIKHDNQLVIPDNYLSSEISSQMTIPIYLPKGLSSSYIVNKDAKAIKANVLSFSVNGPSTFKYSVTEQAIPTTFDFTAFNKKYGNPDVFNADCGYVIAGQIGTNLVASIRTNKNTWILINSSATSNLNELETIVRSLELSK